MGGGGIKRVEGWRGEWFPVKIRNAGVAKWFLFSRELKGWGGVGKGKWKGSSSSTVCSRVHMKRFLFFSEIPKYSL